MKRIGKKEEGRKEGRQAGRKEGRKEYCITIFIYLQNNILHIIKHIYVYTCKYL
jgi:predicted transposase YdaD